MANPAKVAQRVAALKRAGIQNKALTLLEHDLKLFSENTGVKLGGRTGILAPKNMDPRQAMVYESILETFLDNPTSTVKGVREEYKNVQKMREEATRKKLESKLGPSSDHIESIMQKWREDNIPKDETLTKMAKQIDIWERAEQERAVKEILGSDQYKYMWSVFNEQNKGKDKKDQLYYGDMLQAMYDVVVDHDSYMSITSLLGEEENIPATPPVEWTEVGQLEDIVLDHLYNIMEVDR